MEKKNDNSGRMGTSAFKEEINHLLHSSGHMGADGEFDPGWNCRDHALVMAMMLKRGGSYPQVAHGKCMYVQGPYLKNTSFRIGQEARQTSVHDWLVDQKFGLIDVSPHLEVRTHRFRTQFNGIFGQVWLPSGKERTKVVVCRDADSYETEIDKASRLSGLSTAVYLLMDKMEITDQMVTSPFKFLKSQLSAEIKKRFGSAFYPAIAHHLHGFTLGERESLKNLEKLKAWGILLDEFPG